MRIYSNFHNLLDLIGFRKKGTNCNFLQQAGREQNIGRKKKKKKKRAGSKPRGKAKIFIGGGGGGAK